MLAAPAHAARLAYADGALWLAGGDGRGAVRIAGPRGLALSDPAWSPDGARLVVDGGRGDSVALYALGADGRGLTPLPGGRGLAEPAWSPDGATVAALRASGRPEIVALPAAGGTPRVLVAGGFDPAFSPDGTHLAFTRATSTTVEVMVAAADGSGARPVASGGAQPSWSPDGTRLAFTSIADRNGETCFEECSPSGEIHVVGADGSGETRLTRTTADEERPAWSRDGTRIAYTSDRGSSDAGPEVFAMDPDGGCVTQLTWASSEARGVAWQPGSGAAERGPCGARAVPYRLDLDVRAARVRDATALYLGPRFGRRLLSHLLIYDECDGFVFARACDGNVQVQNYTVCKRNPARIDLRATSVRVVRGALVVGYGDRVEVFSGGTDTVIFFAARSAPAALVRRAVAALRPLGAKSARGRLPKPRLPHAVIPRLRDRRILRALERLHARHLPQPACAR